MNGKGRNKDGLNKIKSRLFLKVDILKMWPKYFGHIMRAEDSLGRQ